MFDKVDGQVTKDGFVTKEELEKWIEVQQREHLTKKRDRSVKEYDGNMDGKLSWEEYESVRYEFLKDEGKGAFTKDVRLTPPGGGSEKPDKSGRCGGGRGGGN